MVANKMMNKPLEYLYMYIADSSFSEVLHYKKYVDDYFQSLLCV